MLRLGKLILAIGCLWSAGSVAYWYSFYENILRMMGGRGGLPTECLFTLKGGCGTIATAARFLGHAPYDPRFLWAGLVAVCVGGALIIITSQESQRPSSKQTPSSPNIDR